MDLKNCLVYFSDLFSYLYENLHFLIVRTGEQNCLTLLCSGLEPFVLTSMVPLFIVVLIKNPIRIYKISNNDSICLDMEGTGEQTLYIVWFEKSMM